MPLSYQLGQLFSPGVYQTTPGEIRSFFYEIIVAPTDPLVVTPDELREYMKIDATSLPDAEATALILAAQMQVEFYASIVLLATEFRVHMNGFLPRMDLKRQPLRTGDPVTVGYLSDGAFTIVDPTTYQIVRRSFFGYLAPVNGEFWPLQGVDLQDDAVQISFSAGYDDADAVPANIKFAIMATANYIYTNKGDCGDCSPGDCTALLACDAKMLMRGYRKVQI